MSPTDYMVYQAGETEQQADLLERTNTALAEKARQLEIQREILQRIAAATQTEQEAQHLPPAVNPGPPQPEA